MKTCGKCNAKIPEEEAIEHGSMVLCDDCAMDMMSPAKACDPWAVKMATGSFETKGDAIATLQGVEKKLFEMVSAEGRVPVDQAHIRLGVTPDEVKRRLIGVARHATLVNTLVRPPNVDIHFAEERRETKGDARQPG